MPIGGQAREAAGALARAARRACATEIARRALAVPSLRPQRSPDPAACGPAAQGAGGRGRHRPGTPVAARAAPRLRQPPAGARRRLARRPGHARPCRHRDHPDLYPRADRAPGAVVERHHPLAAQPVVQSRSPPEKSKDELQDRRAVHAAAEPLRAGGAGLQPAAVREGGQRAGPTWCSSTSRTPWRPTPRSRRARTSSRRSATSTGATRPCRCASTASTPTTCIAMSSTCWSRPPTGST